MMVMKSFEYERAEGVTDGLYHQARRRTAGVTIVWSLTNVTTVLLFFHYSLGEYNRNNKA